VLFIHSSFIIFFNIKLTDATMCTIVEIRKMLTDKYQSQRQWYQCRFQL